MRRPLRIAYTGNRMSAHVSGNGAQGLLVELRHRKPMWSSKHRAYVVTEDTAADVLAAAEARGWFVVTSDTRAARESVRSTPEPTGEADTLALEVGLW